MRSEHNERQRRITTWLSHPAALGAMAALGTFLVVATGFYLRDAVQADASAPAKAVAIEGTAEAGAEQPLEQAKAEATAEQPAAAAAADPAAAEAANGDPKPAAKDNDSEMIAFYANWGDEGYKSLEKNAEHIDVLMPMWYHLGSNGKLTVDRKHEQKVMRLIREKNPDMKVMPIVNNYDKATETWNPEAIGKKLRKAKHRKAMAKHIVKTLKANGYDGVNIDFEGFTAKDRKNLVKFMAELYPRAKKEGLTVSMDVIVTSATYDHKKLAKHVDYMVPMMYDEHWKTSGAGPIASIPWFEKTIDRFMEQVPAEKVVVALGTYAYDWGKGGQRASSLSYRDAVKKASKKDKSIKLHPKKLNSTFSYRKGGKKREVWMLDAVSAFNQVQTAQKRKPRGYAIWRIGAEDPELWKVLPEREKLDAKVAQSLDAGKRSVSFDEKRGLIDRAKIRP